MPGVAASRLSMAREKPPRAVERVVQELSREAMALAPGSALPSVRELVGRLGVSPVTVARALAELGRRGVVVTRPGAGTFVAEPARRRSPASYDWQSVALGAAPAASDLEQLVAEAAPSALAISHGYTDVSLEPSAALARAARRVLASPGAWARAPLEGLLTLRAWFATRAGGGVEARDVLIVQGGQAALGTALRAVAPPGAALLVESPTYIGALAAARAAGLVPVPVPADTHGIRTDLLARAFASSGARALYLQPWFSNPTGSVLAGERRAEVLELARAHHAFVIEDDYCHDLSYAGETPRTLLAEDERGHVIYIGSLTKTIAPSLRVAALIARGPVLTRLRAARVVDDFFVPRPLQEIALELVTSSAYPKHVTALRAALAERMRTLVTVVRRELPALSIALVPKGGFSLWLELPHELDEADFVRRAHELDVILSPGRAWYPAEPSGPHVRLSVASASIGDIHAAAERLAPLTRTAGNARARG